MKPEHKGRDILQDIFNDTASDADTTPAVMELNKLIENYTKIFSSGPSASTSKQSANNKHLKPSRAKKKTTHYLSPDTSDALEGAKHAIRSLVSPELKRLVSKSRIVEMALQYVLDELSKKGPKSELVERILHEKKDD